MSKIIIVGTLAFDTIETPFGKVERVLGGSAPFASLASKTQKWPPHQMPRIQTQTENVIKIKNKLAKEKTLKNIQL